jgi:putative tryptophan/tyrosine transport system substrate-binding protein
VRRREVIAVVCGGAVACIGLDAQPAGSYRIAYLALIRGEEGALMRPFVERLRERGLIEGENLTILYRSAEGQPERLPALASELIESKPDVLVAGQGTLTALAAKEATKTIPVVFTIVGDPVGSGLVTSLGRPGGNVTGMSGQVTEIGGKRLQLVREVIPGAKVAGVLLNPTTPNSMLALQELRPAAASANIELKVLAMTAASQLPALLKGASDHQVAALIVLEDPVTFNVQRELVELALQHRLPALFGDRSFALAGGLMSYGPDRRNIFRRAADYVEKILKGAKPAELAVEQPTAFEFVINRKTANVLGVELSPMLLARADEVIE